MAKPRKKRRRPSRAKLSREKAAAIRDANLKPAKPGEVRNPLGKNGHDWRKRLRDYASGLADGEDLPKSVKVGAPGDDRFEVLMKAIFRNVVLGREASQKLMFEQISGRARQHIEVTGGAGNGPVVQFMLPENGRDVAPTAAAGGEDGGEGDDAGGEADPQDADE